MLMLDVLVSILTVFLIFGLSKKFIIRIKVGNEIICFVFKTYEEVIKKVTEIQSDVKFPAVSCEWVSCVIDIFLSSLNIASILKYVSQRFKFT